MTRRPGVGDAVRDLVTGATGTVIGESRAHLLVRFTNGFEYFRPPWKLRTTNHEIGGAE